MDAIVQIKQTNGWRKGIMFVERVLEMLNSSNQEAYWGILKQASFKKHFLNVA